MKHLELVKLEDFAEMDGAPHVLRDQVEAVGNDLDERRITYCAGDAIDTAIALAGVTIYARSITTQSDAEEIGDAWPSTEPAAFLEV